MSKEMQCVIFIVVYFSGIALNFKVLNVGRKYKFPQPKRDKDGYWNEVGEYKDFGFMLATASSWIGVFFKILCDYKMFINLIKVQWKKKHA